MIINIYLQLTTPFLKTTPTKQCSPPHQDRTKAHQIQAHLTRVHTHTHTHTKDPNDMELSSDASQSHQYFLTLYNTEPCCGQHAVCL